MATAEPPRYGGDLALFDTDVVPDVGDLRSVGDLLVDADWQARQLMLHVDADDAAGVVRGWSQVAAAAADLWDALPGRTTPAQRAAGEPPFEIHGDAQIGRIAQLAELMQAEIDAPRADGYRRPWPDVGEPDARMVELANTMQRATALVTRYGGDDVALHRIEVRRDLDAARARLMHSVYIAAHSVKHALQTHGRALYEASVEAGRPLPLVAAKDSEGKALYDVFPVGRWVTRFDATERLAGSYKAGRFTAAIAGAAPTPTDGADRLHRAVVAWDAAASRVSAAVAVSPPNLAFIAGGQSWLGTRGANVLFASDRPGAQPAADALFEASERWDAVYRRWRELADPNAAPDAGLRATWAQLRAAVHEITHAGGRELGNDALATHPALDAAVDAIRYAAQAAPDIAQEFLRHAPAAARAQGQARPLAQRLEGDLSYDDTQRLHGDLIRPVDVQRNALIHPPAPVVEGLARDTARLTDATSTAGAVAGTVQPRAPQLSDAARAALEASGHARVDAATKAIAAEPTGEAARLEHGTPIRGRDQGRRL